MLKDRPCTFNEHFQSFRVNLGYLPGAVALVWAFSRPADIIVLDEPTSPMDCWAEAHWLNRCRNLAAGRTALIVTDRFTTAMRADVIYVIKAGNIIESGTHNELVALGGRYGLSWKEQMRETGECRSWP